MAPRCSPTLLITTTDWSRIPPRGSRRKALYPRALAFCSLLASGTATQLEALQGATVDENYGFCSIHEGLAATAAMPLRAPVLMQMTAQTSPSAAAGLRGTAANHAGGVLGSVVHRSQQRQGLRPSLRQKRTRTAATSPGDLTYIGEVGAQDATWFDGFSDGESTEDSRAADGHGFNPQGIESYLPAGDTSQPELTKLLKAKPAYWFKETASGGNQAAYQTYYPSLPQDFHGDPIQEDLVSKAEHVLALSPDMNKFEEYTSKTEVKNADWFDSSVNQYDAYERPAPPLGVLDMSSWSERTRTTSFSCPDPGCVANTALVVLDAAKEQYHHCLLNVGVHATDFDDEYSNEIIEMLTINGQRLNDCKPMASGCNDKRPKNQRELYPCVTDFGLSDQVLSSGTLNISAKLSPKVDECPVDGNLLSGTVKVTCFVRNITDSVQAAVTKAKAPAKKSPTNVTKEVLLQCKKPGCVAWQEIDLGEAVLNSTCKLTVKLNQTDFDGDHGSSEELEFIQVDGVNVTQNVKPGRNPCKEMSLGNLSNNETVGPFTAIENADVKPGFKVNVTAKISDMVDECGRDGFLLDAIATVTCT